MKKERETDQERLLTIGNKLRFLEGRCVRGWGNWAIGFKEGT